MRALHLTCSYCHVDKKKTEGATPRPLSQATPTLNLCIPTCNPKRQLKDYDHQGTQLSAIDRGAVDRIYESCGSRQMFICVDYIKHPVRFYQKIT